MSDALTRVLFEHGDRKLLNIKFLKGDESVSKKEFRDTVADVLQGIETGLIQGSTTFGDAEVRRVNVKTLASKL